MNRKRKVMLFSVLMLAVVAVLVLITSIAYAGPALTIHGVDACYVPDIAWQVWPVEGPARGDGVITLTENHKGTVNGICTGTLPDGAVLPDRANTRWGRDYPGALCGLPASLDDPNAVVFTNDWRMTITPSGQVQLICKVH